MANIKLAFLNINNITKSLAKEIADFNEITTHYNDDECAIETESFNEGNEIEIPRKIYFDYFSQKEKAWERLPDIGLFKTEVIGPEWAKNCYRMIVTKVDDKDGKISAWIFRLEEIVATEKKCPHCGSNEIEFIEKIGGNGGVGVGPAPMCDVIIPGRERYKCKKCGKSFFMKTQD